MAAFSGKLGRIVGPEDSRDYKLQEFMAYGEATSKLEGDVGWGYRGFPALNQEREGACTMFATCNAANARPHEKNLTSQDAFDGYHAVTEWDQIPGSWKSNPPQEGAIPRDACKEAKKRGWINTYAFEYDVNAILAWILNHGPITLALDWYSGYDNPGPDDTIKRSGYVRGGHDICVIRAQVGVGPVDRVRLKNSWGGVWGKDDYAWMPVSLLSWVMKNPNSCAIAIVD